jgi:hypothetical protein
VALAFHVRLCVYARRDFVPHLPQLAVEDMFLALPKDIDGTSGSTQNVASDNAVREFHVMKAEELHSLIEVQQLFGYFVEGQELATAAIQFFRAKLRTLELSKK